MSQRITRSRVKSTTTAASSVSSPTVKTAQPSPSPSSRSTTSPVVSKRIARSRVKAAVETASSKPSPTAKPRSAKPSSSTKPSPSTSTSSSEPLLFPTPSAFQTWLTHNHLSSPGIWLRLSKKASLTPAPSYDAALDIALCHGWIDGQRKTFNTDHFIQRFTPRRKNSMWSKRNTLKVEKLITEGRMTEQGMREVEKAKEDGRWERAYGGSRGMEAPEDFKGVLGKNEEAKGVWDGLGRTQRFSVLWRIETARPDVRAGKIQQLVEMLAKGEVP